jgi:hypothetical protein
MQAHAGTCYTSRALHLLGTSPRFAASLRLSSLYYHQSQHNLPTDVRPHRCHRQRQLLSMHHTTLKL